MTPSAFTRANFGTTHRLICAIEAREGHGKTHFALTAPSPVFILNIDYGLEGVIQKFQGEKDIQVVNFQLPKISTAHSEDEVERLCGPIWDRVVAAYREALTKARTIVWDTESEIHDIQVLSQFGKLANKPHHYTKVNAVYRDLINEVHQSEANLILLRKLKEDWVDKPDGKGGTVGKKTGEWSPRGFNGLGYLVQVEARLTFDETREESKFQLQVVRKCRQNPDLVGEILTQDHVFPGVPGCSFPGLALQVFPDSDPSDWGVA